jgi:hypothetical protein
MYIWYGVTCVLRALPDTLAVLVIGSSASALWVYRIGGWLSQN